MLGLRNRINIRSISQKTRYYKILIFFCLWGQNANSLFFKEVAHPHGYSEWRVEVKVAWVLISETRWDWDLLRIFITRPFHPWADTLVLINYWTVLTQNETKMRWDTNLGIPMMQFPHVCLSFVVFLTYFRLFTASVWLCDYQSGLTKTMI